MTRATYHLPELDTLRFGAFLSVFLCHLAIATGHDGWLARTGGLGVDLFFALSAFLICGLLLREQDETGTLDMPSCWMRRILRIWPLYFGMLGIALALHRTFSIPLWQLACYAAFLGNFVGLAASHSSSLLVGALWSVSIEEQFYLTWPLIQRRLTRRGVLAVAVGLFVFSAAARAVAIMLNHGPVSVFLDQATFCRLDAIAVGLALAASGARCPDRARPLLGLGGLALVLTSGWWVFHVGGALGQVFALSVVAIGCGALLAASIGTGWMRAGWTGYLGRISYGLYVFHGPALIVGRMVGGIALAPVMTGVTLGAAMASYRYLERPFLRLKARFQYVRSQPFQEAA